MKSFFAFINNVLGLGITMKVNDGLNVIKRETTLFLIWTFLKLGAIQNSKLFKSSNETGLWSFYSRVSWFIVPTHTVCVLSPVQMYGFPAHFD